ncbi:hypothetical protein EBJ43_15475 [Escherichia coli]|nr:hypothetical protein [Escherichia coli]UMS66925.1 hypothetical protein AOY72_08645 [Escherichia coli]
MKHQENGILWRYGVGSFRLLILIKTNSYAREVPTRFSPKNIHKQLRIARIRTPVVACFLPFSNTISR